MIPQSFIDDLLQRVDVVDVVGRHVKLRKGGANLLGLCPFHNEKSPSFTVSPTKQFYHCFGCGAHGTAIGFMIEHGGMTFPEAVRELAQSVGMIVPETRTRAYEGSSSGGTRAPDDEHPSEGLVARTHAKDLVDVLEIATAYYRGRLRQAPRAIAYLKGRGLTGEVAARFGLGYAPDGWNNLRDAFEDYRHPSLVDAGLVIEKDAPGTNDDGSQARAYDRFRDRVMFPIRDTRGRVIAFGGRVIDTGEPKYLNSPETPVFQKGQELYGLFEARQAIREAGFAIVVEGYMDVVALAQSGVANAVATLGTACTPHHVRKLLRQTDRVTFSFDGDAAGQKAAWRALEAALPFAADDKAFAFLFLPEEHDPDSYVREKGREAFVAFAKGALPLSSYLVREVTRTNDLKTAEGRAKALFDARPLVKALPEGALRMQIVRALAQAAGVDVAEIVQSFQISSAARGGRPGPARVARSAPRGLIERALRILLMYPAEALSLTASEIAALEHAAADSRELIVEVVAAARTLGPAADFVAMSAALRESPNVDTYEALMQDILKLAENRRDLLGEVEETAPTARSEGDDANESKQSLQAHELRDSIRRMREQAIREELHRLSSAGALSPADAESYRRLIDEQNRLRGHDPAERAP